MNDDHRSRNDGDDGDDGEGGGLPGSGSGMAMRPSSGDRSGESFPTEADDEGDLQLVGVIPDEDDYPHSVDELNDRDNLPNEMVVGIQGGRWYLFDTDGTRYGPFGTRERAIEVAFLIRSWGPTP